MEDQTNVTTISTGQPAAPKPAPTEAAGEAAIPAGPITHGQPASQISGQSQGPISGGSNEITLAERVDALEASNVALIKLLGETDKGGAVGVMMPGHDEPLPLGEVIGGMCQHVRYVHKRRF